MSEIFLFIVGAAITIFLVYIGYAAGKDAATRQADYTISALRHSLRASRAEVDALREKHAVVVRMLNKRQAS